MDKLIIIVNEIYNFGYGTGVTSYTIDLATKKVTVVGKITPVGVVESISKVKFAQLWPSNPQIPNHSLLKS